jgi:hypothetical protein
MASIITLGAGLMVALAVTTPEVAASAMPLAGAHMSAPAPSGHVCVVKATAFVQHGNDKVVTASSATCYSSYFSYLASKPDTQKNIGYGCKNKDFRGGPCWYFAVNGSCGNSFWWEWNTLDSVIKNHMESWKAINGCTTGDVYSKPDAKGSKIACNNVCKSLGVVNDHDQSLYTKA